MKRYFLLAAFTVFCIAAASSQHTLEFNQVILVNGITQSVPANKVWKVTGILPVSEYRYTTSSGTGPYEFTILVNGNPRYIGHGSFLNGYYNAGFSMQTIIGDIWLPAGTQLAASSNVGEISVIEFNIIP